MNEFVTFDIAKILNEKGFREKCLAYYDVLDNVGLLYNTQYTDDISPCQYTDLLFSHNSGEGKQTDDSEYCVDAPTIEQVLTWMRKEKKIHLELVIVVDGEYMCDIYKIDVRPLECLGSTEYFKTYEQAAIAGIEYVIENII